MLDKFVNNKQTHFLKENFSETITPIHNLLLLNHSYLFWVRAVSLEYDDQLPDENAEGADANY